MKKQINVLMIVLVVAAFMAASLTLWADSQDDYKVIKKAVDAKKGDGTVTMIRIEVTEKGTQKSKVKIKVPLSLVELFSDCSEDLKINTEKCKVDLKKILSELKKSGPMTMVEVEEEDTLVKIWLE